MVRFYLNVFSGRFEDEASAFDFAEYHYPPEHDDEPSELPTCSLARAVGTDFTPDYRETIWGDDRYEYLLSLLVDPEDVERVRQRAAGDDNVLFLIFEVDRNKGLTFSQHPVGLRACGRFRGAWK